MGQAPSKNLQGRPTVVVIGGGYAGMAVAQALDKDFNVVVIERKSYFMHNIGGARAAVDPAFANNVLIPYTHALKNGHVVEAEVTEVSPAGIRVYGVDAPFKPDYVVVATGTSFAFPATVAPPSAAEARKTLLNAQRALEGAQRVVIVGGGAVGCELAGEIKAKYADKAVTIVHAGSALLDDRLPEKFRHKAQANLEASGVQLRLGSRVRVTPEMQAQRRASGAQYVVGPVAVELENVAGTRLDADLVYFCSGPQVNKKSYAATLPVDESGRLKVNTHLQVEGQTTVFALGDCNNVPETKLAYNAGLQAPVAAANIRALDKKGAAAALKAYKPGGYNTMLLPCGPRGGAVLLGGNMMGNKVAAMFKSKHLFASKYWATLHADFPDGKETQLPPLMSALEPPALAEQLGKLKLPKGLADVRAHPPSELTYT